MSPVSDSPVSPPSPSPLEQARQTFQQAVQRYAAPGPTTEPRGAQAGVDQLVALYERLTAHTLRVAVFGLVSRGKSTVINALLGKPVLETGPLHGVTRWPRSVYWQPEALETPWQVEFIDTPGLDEIAGAVRADMAQTVAQQADLILFVVAGEITRTEYEALQQLQQTHKPLLLIFNKIDLYPEVDQDAIEASLQVLHQQVVALTPTAEAAPLSPDRVIRVAADPAPLQVRVEWPDGRVAYEWEKPAPQIAGLQAALSLILQQDAAALVALNTLRQARELEAQLVSQVTHQHQGAADDLIWRFARYKALAVALNPIAVLDLLGGLVADLVMIRALARLYNFPITHYQASQLWGSILKSSGWLLGAELASGLLGAGKSLSALLSLVNSPAGIPALGSAMVVQAAASGYGTYAVGQAAKRYLEQGCTWGPAGMSRGLQTVLEQTDSSEVLARLRQELQTTLDEALAAANPPAVATDKASK